MEIKYIPLITLDNKYLYTSNDLEFNVKQYPDGYFSLTLYKSTAEEHRVDKTNYLTQVGELGGVLRDTTSLINIAIEIEYKDVPNFNYVYISKFNRYYYVTDITSIRTNIWEISLSVDVLMSYKNGILNLKGFIDRNEFTFDNYLDDKKRVIQEGYTVDVSSCENEIFDTEPTPTSIVGGGTYVLTGLTLKVSNEIYEFTVNGIKFYCAKNVTWDNWIVTTGNNYGFGVAGAGADSFVVTLNGDFVYREDDLPVYADKMIIENGVYHT